MQPEDALPTIAEIAITLAGFSSLVAVWRPLSAAPWSKQELLRIHGLLISSAVVLLCALLPFGLSGVQSSNGVTWGFPLVIYSIINLGYVALTLRRIFSRELEVTSPRLVWSVLITSGAVNSILLLSGLGILLPHSAGVLVLGLVWGFVTAVVSLLATITHGRWVHPMHNTFHFRRPRKTTTPYPTSNAISCARTFEAVIPTGAA